MHEENHFIVIGRIKGPYGLKGEVRIEPFLKRSHWKSLKRLFLKRKGGDYIAFDVESIKYHGKDKLILRFKGFTSVEQAEKLKGAKVFLPVYELPKCKEDEYYYFELEGIEVYTERGKYLGRITAVIEKKPYGFLELDGGRGYIPFVEKFVKKVDKEKRIIIVSESLADIY
ncbi:MAG: ribosome maturation factor RimM [Aquificaceae bacterium]